MSDDLGFAVKARVVALRGMVGVMDVIRAAGGLVWRDDGRARRIALVHRPDREDWSLPKGKLKDGERWEDAALREVQEETGCEVRLLSFAGVACDTARRTPKVVLYWNMALVSEGRLASLDEIDEVAWLLPSEALERLDRRSDRALLREALDLGSPDDGMPGPAGAPARPVAVAALAGAGLGCALTLALAQLATAPLAGLLTGGALAGGLAGGAAWWLLVRR